MAFDTAAGANALLAVLNALSLGGAQIGVPESIGPRVYGTVTAASQAYQKVSLGRSAGLTARDTRYTVTLAYRLDGNESDAELTLMAKLDALVRALAIGTQLAGAAGQVTALDTGLADAPEYQTRAGKEFREYPVLITLRQYG